ncbi:MAG: imidazole glycerol phosphate synthase subunit HisH [Clostridia bacterium]|nr:imidazole glycerol phosphate synthase subunit HisH [Clostridia bacterium]
MLAIIDYGVGNIFSLYSSFKFIGEDVVLTNDKKVIDSCSHIILPGVGAFADARRKLEESGMAEVVKEQVKTGKPLMGICLGMQMLFDKSYEYGEHDGLGLIKGSVRPISEVIPSELKIPHIGWNALEFTKETGIFKHIKNGDHVYFVHSYWAADCAESTTSVTEYGAKLTASVQSENVYGCQFHPEKSGEVGLNILKAFCEL